MNKKTRKTVEVILVAVLLGVIILMLTSVLTKKYAGGHEEAAVYLEENWYYLKDGEKVEVEFPLSLKGWKEPLVLYNDGLTKAAEGKTISTRGAKYDLSVALDDQIFYQYNDEAFPRNIQMANKLNCDMVLPLEVEGRTLSLTFQNTDNGNFRIKEILLGKSGYIFWRHLTDSALLVSIVFFMAILGFIAIGVSIYLHKIHIREKRFVDAAFFLFICGTWCATDSSLVQHLTDFSPVTNYISFYAFMLLAIPMLHFVRNTGEMYRYKVLDVLIWCFYVNAIGQSILNHFFDIDLIDMLFVSHLLLFVGVGLTTMLLVKEYKETRDKEIYTILIAFATVAAGGVLAMILYWLLEITFYDLIFECGILVFVFILFCRIIISTVENMRFKTEALVYQRLAKEDRMTGIPNRLAFDEYLLEIEEKADTFENLVLIFMDINKLKRINDTYGHGAGDELIISAAKVVEKAFGEFGRYFRIGGDEFCAIIPCSGPEERDWNQILDREIIHYNQMGGYPLDIARGMCFLRGEDGNLRSISDWKYAADQEMYRNKGWRRVNESSVRG